MFLKTTLFVCLFFFVRVESYTTTENGLSGNTPAILSTSYMKNEENCTPAAINEFPSDGLTKEQRRSGWIAIHIFLTIYCFVVLSTVCDAYFVPAIQLIVKRLNLSEDVVGASFMAITNSSPELFINFVGTFVTEGDIGVGTVVGSNVFNILAVPVCCGLLTKTGFHFDWWLIIRDGLIYGFSVVLLIITLSDDRVYWYEALTFVLVYSIYILALYFSEGIRSRLSSCCCGSKDVETGHELQRLNEKTQNCVENKPEQEANNIKANNHAEHNGQLHKPPAEQPPQKDVEEENEEIFEHIWNVWTFPSETSLIKKVWWVFVWPILFFLKYTIPNAQKHHSLFPLTLLMCICWIGSTTYLLSWFITVIGDTINIPDSVMGLVFLAIGSSIPEIVSSIIVTRHGQGVMGMSSALGANNFEVLLCLGFPWLIKTLFYPNDDGEYWVHINSSGMAYSAACLLTTLILLYVTIICNKFKLDWKTGIACLVMYCSFLVIGTLIELNVFFVVNLPTCT